MVIITCMDWWMFELMIFTSGYFGPNSQAAQIVLMNITMTVYLLAQGIGYAVVTLVGKEIGRGKPELAKRYYKIILTDSFLFILFVAVVVHFSKDYAVSSLTDIESVKTSAQEVIFYISLNTVPELLKGVLKGGVKALGIQKQAVIVHLLGNWVLSPSLQYYFCFVQDYGLHGIWIAKLMMETFIVAG